MIVLIGVNVENDLLITNNPWGIRGEQTFENFVSGFVGFSDVIEMERLYVYFN